MKVLNLQCAQEHSFEGWFASEEDYHAQLERQLVSCPLCGDAKIQKMLSAPRLNLRTSRGEPLAKQEPAEALAGQVVNEAEAARASAANGELQARLMKAVREVLAQTEDVGERFADQVRGMHHGDIQQRSIRGQTSPEVAMELIEEGIDVVALPSLPHLKETLQ